MLNVHSQYQAAVWHEIQAANIYGKRLSLFFIYLFPQEFCIYTYGDILIQLPSEGYGTRKLSRQRSTL